MERPKSRPLTIGPVTAQQAGSGNSIPIPAPRRRMEGLKNPSVTTDQPVTPSVTADPPVTAWFTPCTPVTYDLPVAAAPVSTENPPIRERDNKFSPEFILARIQKQKTMDAQFIENIDFKTNKNIRRAEFSLSRLGKLHTGPSEAQLAFEKKLEENKAKSLVFAKMAAERSLKYPPRIVRPNRGEGDAKPAAPITVKQIVEPPKKLKGPEPAYKVMDCTKTEITDDATRFPLPGTSLMTQPQPEPKVLSTFDFDEPRTMTRGGDLTPDQIVVYFACKDESFELRKHFKELNRVLKRSYRLSVLQLQEELGEEGMLPACSIIILAGIRKPLLPRELRLLAEFLEGGGKIIVLAEAACNTGIYNDFTRQFGITVIKDTVIRIDRYKRYHPQECYIQDAMICPTLMKTTEDGQTSNLSILYPHGCTLEVSETAMPLIYSGLSSFPNGRPLCGIYINPTSKGKLIVMGSGGVFTDQYINLEDNMSLLTFLVDLLTNPEDLALEPVHIDDFHLNDYNVGHETATKSSLYRPCMLDTDEFVFPGCVDVKGTIQPKKLISSDLAQVNFRFLPEVIKLYDQLHLPRKPMRRFIMPRLELPMAKLQLAQFPPKFRDLEGPPLELFDLDEEFSGREAQLGRMINKCNEDDLEYCIEMLGTILDVPGSDEDASDPTTKCKRILHSMASDMAAHKCSLNSSGSNTPLDLASGDDDDDSMKSSLNEPRLRPVPIFSHSHKK